MVLKTFSECTEAELAKAMLETQGIGALIVADDCDGMHTAMTYTIGHARLMVLEKNAEAPLTLLEME